MSINGTTRTRQNVAWTDKTLRYNGCSLSDRGQVRRSERNRLLAALPREQQAELAPALETVFLEAKQIVGMPDEQVRHIFFPRAAVLSLLVPMEDGGAVEGATLGNEGLVGLHAFLGEGTGTGGDRGADPRRRRPHARLRFPRRRSAQL
jgi:hypothetical protein